MPAIKGTKFSEEHKQRIAGALRGKPKSVEHNEHNRQSHIGRKLSEEHKQKISLFFKGRVRGPMSEEQKQKISQTKKERGLPSPNKGKSPSTETRMKQSIAMSGRTLTEEHKAKCGHTPTEWHKQRLREAHSCEGSYLWKGGISFEPYCRKFNRAFKERVRKFFNRTCQGCGKIESKRKHDVHHVNFNKMTCCDGTPPLFVSLCRGCHVKTNHNREYWEEYYTNLINEKYGGKCYLPE